VATALVVLARWGIATNFIGLISNDSFGKAIQKSLEKEGVDSSGTIIRKGRRSQFAFICIEKNTGRRTIFWARPECAPIQPEELPMASIAAAEVLHLDGLFVEASIRAAKYANRRKIPVVLDAGSLRPGMLEVVRHTDHLIAAEQFAKEYAEGEPYESALHRLRRLGPKVVVVTLGERGSIGLWNDRVLHVPALPVKALDTTGAGDVFHGAYVFGLLRKWDPAKRLALATTAAALSCRAIGGRSGIPALKEALTKMKELPPCTSWVSSGALGPPRG